jgi:hypothetical protein
MTDKDRPIRLDATGRDRAVAVARALGGAVPYAGSLIAELITEFIPGQRQDRIVEVLISVAERLDAVEEATLRERLREPENIALIEEAAYQAARAISEERRQQIANLVAEGITDDRRDYIESRRVLRLLGELDDAEVIILASYLQKNREGDYRERHANLLGKRAAHLESSRHELDARTVRSAAEQHLGELWLLERSDFGARPIGQVSGLGRLLLRRIGLADPDDY